MVFGPSICAACVQAHHLYLRRDGCPDDLTVWLCPDCHGRAHGLTRQINTSERTCLALVATKGRQVPPSAVETAAIKAKADTFAARVGPIVRELQAEGKGLGLTAVAPGADQDLAATAPAHEQPG